ncbi:MAG: hypothetical protein AAGA62_13620, partial [Bacteroidota bacterium]
IANWYSIPYVEIVPTDGYEVNFPALDDVELTGGAMYRLQLIREPRVSTSVAMTEEEETLEDGRTVVRRQVNSAIAEEIAEETKILYEYHFGVSKFPSLSEKLAASTVSYLPSQALRNDFSHPDAPNTILELAASENHVVRDDYYGFNNDQEGFDQFDLLRIRRNMQVEYKDRYYAQEKIAERYNVGDKQSPNEEMCTNFNWVTCTSYSGIDDAPSGSGLPDYLYDYLNWNGDPGNLNYTEKEFLKKVLANSDNFQPNWEDAEGSTWHYNFYLPKADISMNNTDSEVFQLSQTEVDNLRMNSQTGATSKYDGSYRREVFPQAQNFDLLFQDLRSRIVINQMRWLSEIGSYEGGSLDNYSNWHKDNYPEGQFFSWGYNQTSSTGGGTDFSWIIPPNPQSHDFIADERGYRYSYHGRTELKFPTTTKWKDMVEIKSTGSSAVGTVSFEVQPNHISSGVEVEQIEVTQADMIRPDRYYQLKVNGQPIRISN